MPDIDERFLQHLFGALAAPQYTECHTQKMRAGGTVHALEGRPIVQSHTRHQGAEVIGCRHRVLVVNVGSTTRAAIVAWSAPLDHRDDAGARDRQTHAVCCAPMGHRAVPRRDRAWQEQPLATPNYAYEKRQRELAKKRKAEEKRQRKQTGRDDASTPAQPDNAAPTPAPSSEPSS